MLIALMIIWVLITFPISYSLSGIIFDVTYKTKYYEWKSAIDYGIVSLLQLILFIIFYFIDKNRTVIQFPLLMFCFNFSILLSEPVSVFKKRIKDRMENQGDSKLRLGMIDLCFTVATFLIITTFLLVTLYFVCSYIFDVKHHFFGFFKYLFSQ